MSVFPGSSSVRTIGGQNRILPRAAAATLRHSVAPLLVVSASFASFLSFHDYGLVRPEVLISFAVLGAATVALSSVCALRRWLNVFVLAAVLTFFIDVQFLEPDFWFLGRGELTWLVLAFLGFVLLLWPIRAHASRVIALMAATVLLSTLLLSSPRAAETTGGSSRHRTDLPLVVHVVLDEHQGIDGLNARDPGLAAEVRAFYEKNGFRVFGAAYSEFDKTEYSLGHLVNFLPRRYDHDLVQGGGSTSPFWLKRNRYFSGMSDRGYDSRIYQTDWLILCPKAQSTVTCHTYKPRGATALHDLPVTQGEKARLLVGLYLGRSKLYTTVNRWYPAGRRALASVGVHLPAWTLPYHMNSINSLTEARRVIDDLTAAREGQFWFAHLMMPHDPFMYDSDCTLLPHQRWVRRGDAANRLDGYGRQVRCTMKVVQEMLDAIPESLRAQSVFIVHGDHGTRFSPLGSLPAGSTVSLADHKDNYSTLFAVRAPELGSGYDSRPAAISCLLSALTGSAFQSVSSSEACFSEPSVFTRDSSGRFVASLISAIQ